MLGRRKISHDFPAVYYLFEGLECARYEIVLNGILERGQPQLQAESSEIPLRFRFGHTLSTISSPSVLAELPFQERGLYCRGKVGSTRITICSFHTPPGASWGKLKTRSDVELAEWLAGRGGPTLLGIDANSPKVDHPDLGKTEWWYDEEAILLGAEKKHRLRDALRLYLDANPRLLRHIKAQRPNGPLAVSHIRGNQYKRTESRYDYIFVSPEVKVQEVEYVYSSAIEAGSDHALVFANLSVWYDSRTMVRLTSRWIGPGMVGAFGVSVVCSGRLGGRLANDPGRSARGRSEQVSN
jgi:hypothetical protein